MNSVALQDPLYCSDDPIRIKSSTSSTSQESESKNQGIEAKEPELGKWKWLEPVILKRGQS